MSSRIYKIPDKRAFKSPINPKNQLVYTSKLNEVSKLTGNWKLRDYNFQQNLKQDLYSPYTKQPSKSAQYSFLRKTIDYPGANYQPTEFQINQNHQAYSKLLRSTYTPSDESYLLEKPYYNYEKYPRGYKQKQINFLSRCQNQKNQKLKTFTDISQRGKPENQQDYYQKTSKKVIVSPRNRAKTEEELYIKQRLKISIANSTNNYDEKNSEKKQNSQQRKFTKKPIFQCYVPKIDSDTDVSPTSQPKAYSNATSLCSSKYLAYKNDKRDGKNGDSRPSTEKKQLQQKEAYFSTATQATTTKSFSFKVEKISQRTVSINDFHIREKLGEGRYGKVFKAFHKQTGAVFALKKLKKEQIKQHNLILQIKMQLMFNHPNILKLYGFFHDTQYLYLILQYMPSKTLFSYLKQKGKLSEIDTSDKLRQINRSIHYLHQLNIAHRDIKPQNIVMCYDICKLCDFGSSAVFDNRRKTTVGTPDYACPEVLIGQEYGIQIDYWALGILCYQLLIGKAPFYHHRVKQTFKKIMNVDKTQLVFPQTISDQAIEFINFLLVKDPSKRMGTDDAMKHPFITMYMDDQDQFTQ